MQGEDCGLGHDLAGMEAPMKTETPRDIVKRGTIPCPRCQRILLVDTKGDVTQCNRCGDDAFVEWNVLNANAPAETITNLAKRVNEIYGTELTEKLLEVATSAEQRLEELQTCQLCESIATYSYCRKHR